MVSIVHCYNCYAFPSENLEFFVSNCMHNFCSNCHSMCIDKNVPKCISCSKSPVKFMKMTSKMPTNVKQYYLPLQSECAMARNKISKILAFQQKQRGNLLMGLKKKEEVFEKLKSKLIEEKNKREQYRQALQLCQIKFKEKCEEVEHLKSLSSISNTSYDKTTAPSISTKSLNLKRNDNHNHLEELKRNSSSNPYKTPLFPVKLGPGLINPYVTPKNTKSLQIPKTDRMKNSLNSNSSASFIDTSTDNGRPPSQAKSVM